MRVWSDDDLAYLSATEAVELHKAGDIRPTQVLAALQRRIDRFNPGLNALTMTCFDRAFAQASVAEERYRAGHARPLEGIALTVKDSTAMKGELTTFGSKVYQSHRPERTHPGLQRLLDAGAIVIGRSTMPEFGEAGNCYTPLWGVTRNPWNPVFGPGGSSSGAGVVLAAGFTTIADGSDIGGSIRIPAACCGVLGYKAPYGRNPNSYAATFDPYMHYGPLARTVSDIALMQRVLAGRHVEDIGTVAETIDYPLQFEPPQDWRVAYSVDLGYFQVDDEVRRNLLDTVAAFREMGCAVEEVVLDWTEETFDAWLAVNATRGAAARMVPDLERWRTELADYTLDMIEHGAALDNGTLVRAMEVHVAMYRTLGPVLERCNVFLCPTNAIPSVEADRSPLDLDIIINGELASRTVASAWFMTYPFNMLSQLPVLSVPNGFASSGIPTGVQIVGRSFDDLGVLQAGTALERARPWSHHRPQLVGTD